MFQYSNYYRSDNIEWLKRIQDDSCDRLIGSPLWEAIEIYLKSADLLGIKNEKTKKLQNVMTIYPYLVMDLYEILAAIFRFREADLQLRIPFIEYKDSFEERYYTRYLDGFTREQLPFFMHWSDFYRKSTRRLLEINEFISNLLDMAIFYPNLPQGYEASKKIYEIVANEFGVQVGEEGDSISVKRNML